MTGDVRAPAPLRPGDPVALGPYTLLGRLGQGGMGTVYLARDPDGGQVAVKMIRADLAPDDEFRRRFRGEVERVRQVPPFCTAEVLDADPDHDPPYLVVEFVDGPSLAEVVQQRGPLTAANLHGVAIGVATALTAIHGAGVIHRDLKPRNVLLAPGSPKVIDFGIARAMEATTRHTGTDQMVGTVAYMAPERFGPQNGALTPAADIFAWGAVVAYAGTGRTPFGADSAPATAGRILTQPPDLSGLAGPLRSLIAHALAKAPGDRPTARELLDLLLSHGAQRSPAAAAALADQPGLRAAAREAQAATDHAADGSARPGADGSARPGTGGSARPGADGSARPGTGQGSPVGAVSVGGALDGPTHAVGLPVTTLAEQPTQAPRRGARIPAQQSAAPLSPAAPAAVPVTPVPVTPVPVTPVPVTPVPAAQVPVAETVPVAEPVARRRRWWPAVVALLVALIGGGAVVTVGWPRVIGPAAPGGSGATAAGGPGSGTLLFRDPLVGRRYWHPSADREEEAGCSFAGAMIVRRQTEGSFRCHGPLDEQSADQRVEVGVRLRRAGSCASIWFRFAENQGYQVRICESALYVGTHKSADTEVYKTFPLDRPIDIGARSTRISVTAHDNQVEVSRDGERVGSVLLKDPDITGGRVMLGIFTEPRGQGHVPPFEVAFDNVTVWSLP